MRQALLEYDYDWSMQRIFHQGSYSLDGTRKEFERAKSRFPTFGAIMEIFFQYEEVGKAMTRGAAKYINNIVTAHDDGRKVALTTFCMSPALCYAMEVVPLLIEPITAVGNLSRKFGMGEFMDYCLELGFAETACSAQRGAMGAYLAGAAQKPDFVLCNMSGVCDTNTSAFAFAAEMLDIPLFQCNFPPEMRGHRADAYHQADYRAMIDFIAEQTGKPLDPAKLRDVLAEIQKQDELIVELQDYQRMIPSPIPTTFNLFMYLLRFLFGGTADGTEAMEAMLKVVRQNVKEGKAGVLRGEEKARALFLYTDHYGGGLPLWDFLDSRGITHLGCIADRFYQQAAPYVKDDEGYVVDATDLDSMIDTMAALNSRMPMVKQIRGPYDAPDMWLDEIRAQRELYAPDFAVYMGTPGCRNTWGMIKLMAKELEKEGLPTLIINADVFDERVESWSMTKARFEEFLEIRRIAI